MKVLLIGANGNMGRRYQAILKYLGHQCYPMDIQHSIYEQQEAIYDGCDHVIIATPTDIHEQSIYDLCNASRGMAIQVLCEKPVVTSAEQLADIYSALGNTNLELFVVNQYRYLELPENNLNWNWASYDYWNSGKDGLAWDCFQLFAMTSGPVRLKNESPTWECTINGSEADIADMDHAYIDMIRDFLGPQEKLWGWDVIEKTTLRILDYLAEAESMRPKT